MTALWVSDTTIKKWILEWPSDVFCEKYDSVQQQIMQISCSDDLLTGRRKIGAEMDSEFTIWIS